MTINSFVLEHKSFIKHFYVHAFLHGNDFNSVIEKKYLFRIHTSTLKEQHIKIKR